MTEDSAESEPLHKRLERLHAKAERGEGLTDAEVEQLNEDMRTLRDATESLAMAVVDMQTEVLREMKPAIESLSRTFDVEVTHD